MVVGCGITFADMHFAPHRTVALSSANDNPRSQQSERQTGSDQPAQQRGTVTICDAIRELVSATSEDGSRALATGRPTSPVGVWAGKMPLRITAKGRRDLQEIHRYTVETHSPDRGHAYLRDLEAALDLIAAYPNLGRLVDGQLRRFVRGKHVVLYRIVVGVVLIDRIFHGAQRR